MRRSDDKQTSNLHRVRMPGPEPGERLGPRYSIACFVQAIVDTVLEDPEKKYDAVTGHDGIQMRLGASFGKE